MEETSFQDALFGALAALDVTGIGSAISLALGPILVAFVLAFCWRQRRRPETRPLYAVVPFAATILSVYAFVAALTIIQLFQSIAATGAGGVNAVADAFIMVTKALEWRTMEVLRRGCSSGVPVPPQARTHPRRARPRGERAARLDSGRYTLAVIRVVDPRDRHRLWAVVWNLLGVQFALLFRRSSERAEAEMRFAGAGMAR